MRINKKQTRITIPATKKVVLEFIEYHTELKARCFKCYYQTRSCGDVPCGVGDRIDGNTGYYRVAK